MIIGITGAMGGGKSTLLKAFDRFGIATCSADLLAHRQYLPGSELIKTLLGRWGDEILDKNGELDRKMVAQIVFGDARELEFLSQAIAPGLQDSIREVVFAARRDDKDLVLEIPLLFEYGYEKMLDQVVVVDVAEAIRKTRLVGRGMSEDDISERDSAQLTAQEKCSKANIVLDNSGNELELETKCGDLIRRWGLKKK